MSESKSAKLNAAKSGKATEKTSEVLSKSAVNVEKKVGEQKQAAKDAPKPPAQAKPETAAKTATKTETKTTETTGAVKGVENQGTSSADKAKEAVETVEAKPANVAAAETNMDFVGAMVRGHGMGVDA